MEIRATEQEEVRQESQPIRRPEMRILILDNRSAHRKR
jgi:hypothetical protein